jgi:ubiquinone/menaquinone biosynthesis C-methylase UbiE
VVVVDDTAAYNHPMSRIDPYAEIAPYYDLEFDEFDDDVHLYLGYAHAVGGPLLELGCGSGRLLVPLAEAGFEVHGLDNSASMIDRARRRVEAAGLTGIVRLSTGDMRDLSGYSTDCFRLVFAAINSFLHLESREQHLAALRSVRSVIDRNGLLVLDIFNPTPETLLRMDDRLTFDGSWPTGTGQRVERFSHRQLDPAAQTIHTSLFYDVVEPDGTMLRRTTSYVTRYVHQFEMEALLSETGFEIEGVYGSYALDPLQRDSTQMIFVAHRTANPGESD